MPANARYFRSDCLSDIVSGSALARPQKTATKDITCLVLPRRRSFVPHGYVSPLRHRATAGFSSLPVRSIPQQAAHPEGIKAALPHNARNISAQAHTSNKNSAMLLRHRTRTSGVHTAAALARPCRHATTEYAPFPGKKTCRHLPWDGLHVVACKDDKTPFGSLQATSQQDTQLSPDDAGPKKIAVEAFFTAGKAQQRTRAHRHEHYAGQSSDRAQQQQTHQSNS